jgi:hypothetical protein
MKLMVVFVFLFSVAAASTHEPNPNFNEELDQETPQQLKQEAQKPDAKASAGDLAKATQNPVASLISVPLQNVTDFNVGPFDRDRNTVIQFQPVIPTQLSENWNVGVQAYGNAKRPDNFRSPTWRLKFQIAFLYPKKPKGEQRTPRISLVSFDN